MAVAEKLRISEDSLMGIVEAMHKDRLPLSLRMGTPGGRRQRPPVPGRPRRVRVIFVAAAALLLLLAAGLWLGLRGYLAEKEIARAEGLAKSAQAEIVAGHATEARDAAQQLTVHVDAAYDYVSDPVWRAAGFVPVVGANFSTVTELARTLSDVTHGAVVPLADASSSISLSAVKPAHGVLDLQSISSARPAVGRASAVLNDAYKKVAMIRPGFGTIPPVQDGISRFRELLGQAAQQASAANTAAMVLPPMLGDQGPRRYLVLFQNNAELRSSGGIPGAVAEVEVDHGRITLGRQTEAKDLSGFSAPVLPLSDQTKGLYGPIVGQFFQDVNLVPQFPLTANLASEMWRQRYGGKIDGVFSLDPVALSYMLQATGPVSLPTGEALNSDNAVQLLLSDAYSRYHGVGKDDFFSTAASAVFTQIASGSFQPKPMIDALNRAVVERRLLAWSSQQIEQEAFESARMAGELPAQTPERGVFGVYLNDATGAKMDYYLRESYRTGGAMCRADGRPAWEVEVTLTNAAPADAATSLPEYVTGGGVYGVKPGDVKTQVNVYAPPSAIYMGTWKDSAPLDVHRDMDSGYPVAQTNVQLSPGQTIVLRFQFLGAAQAGQEPELVSTPTVNNPGRSDLPLSCHDVSH